MLVFLEVIIGSPVENNESSYSPPLSLQVGNFILKPRWSSTGWSKEYFVNFSDPLPLLLASEEARTMRVGWF